MPSYDESPSAQAVLKRTRERISTVRSALTALAGATTRDGNERARQASKNLEMLVDRREMRQLQGISAYATDLDAKLSGLKSECQRFSIRQVIEPERLARLLSAIRAFIASPVSSGAFVSDNPNEVRVPVAPRLAPSAPSGPVTRSTATGSFGSAALLRDDSADSFTAVLLDEARCKSASTCPRLTVRSRFHEPNARTLSTWQAKEGFYRTGIDRRVAFVCESPSKTPDPPPPDFVVEGVEGYRCWAGYNARNTDRFTAFRRKFGLQDCFITNVVKCGVMAGKPDASDIRRCSQFLWRELRMIQPGIIACVGKATLEMVRESMRHWPASLVANPPLMYFTHYSAPSRGGMTDAQLNTRWESEFLAIKNELRARGFEPDRPVYVELR